MTMFYLRADTEAAMRDEIVRVLDGAIVTDEDGDEQIVFYNHRWALDWNVPITLTPAVVDENGDIVTPVVMSADFHANLKILDPDALLDFPFGIESVNPNNPQRGFA